MSVKLLTNDEKKIAIQAELISGANARKLAEKYGVHYTTVVNYRNEQRERVVNAEVLDVSDADGAMFKMVADEVKAKAIEAKELPPKTLAGFVSKVDDLASSVSSLQLLDTAFHETITKLLTWANAQINDDMSLKDWKSIASTIGDLHTAVFSKGTTVNVQQNNSTSNFSSGMVN